MATSTLGLILMIVFVVLFSGIGILLILLHQRNKKKAQESMSWHEIGGTIIKSGVAMGESVFGGDDEQGQSQPMYSPEISYTYQVEDMLYTSDRVSFAGKSSYSKAEKAELIAAKYPDGSKVTVFYNPAKPEEAVLERSAKGSAVLLIAGIVFLVVGLISLVVGSILLL
jgi:preprotein translocase subunit YajC